MTAARYPAARFSAARLAEVTRRRRQAALERRLAEPTTTVEALEDHGPGCDGPLNCTCTPPLGPVVDLEALADNLGWPAPTGTPAPAARCDTCRRLLDPVLEADRDVCLVCSPAEADDLPAAFYGDFTCGTAGAFGA